ncbi:UDP-3-O-(3-hydroxymyristoyl) N-acetylglucosamine deacetylase [Liberibacter crescens BT-1]|uniref:UDP-3-O-acyl-N-acetylglucosamine deacetylase n=1 Tax=Liberibacter crescens (strain BT-1) TaxID=1215343 RepID=L0EUS9_LIBCB|nr:UDP-3-O-acyl-N-acetylglucosamine deacetylase [Liberibacter crescens]AGA64590.1 UDP-3-O-(3-hydroxymyristoyl) N-acetylglucosamine deacetylase [Liberibacter crescens BT-1]
MKVDFLGCQNTVSSSIKLSGIGVHSGKPVDLVLHPAEIGTGIIFHRLEDDGSIKEFPASWCNVLNTDLCTVLGKSHENSLSTVEHIMAALYAFGIDNIIVEVNGSEIPIMDGSSLLFVRAIKKAGIKSFGIKRRYIRIKKKVRVQNNNSWAEFVPYKGTRFEVAIEFDTSLIGYQKWEGDLTTDVFCNELCGARTFGFMRDVKRYWANGCALGSSLQNSVVISDDDTILNVEGLRYPGNEFVRHKTLDAIGDLALAGAQFIGCYRSFRGGHKMNSLALKALFADPTSYEVVNTSVLQKQDLISTQERQLSFCIA